MKKILYVALFTLLGLIIATIVHALIEAPLLCLITGDLDRWGNSFIWQNWEDLHRYVGGFIWTLGLTSGIYSGFKYWRIVYVERRYGQSKF